MAVAEHVDVLIIGAGLSGTHHLLPPHALTHRLADATPL
jgi:cation diffusion facilitator CzcD-associated flavoprotein CzcO